MWYPFLWCKPHLPITCICNIMLSNNYSEAEINLMSRRFNFHIQIRTWNPWHQFRNGLQRGLSSWSEYCHHRTWNSCIFWPIPLAKETHSGKDNLVFKVNINFVLLPPLLVLLQQFYLDFCLWTCYHTYMCQQMYRLGMRLMRMRMKMKKRKMMRMRMWMWCLFHLQGCRQILPNSTDLCELEVMLQQFSQS